MKFYLFADDTNLLYEDKNLKSLESTINDELCKLYDWLIANKLSLSIKKSNYVIFRPRQKKVKYEVNLKILNHHTNFYTSLEHKSYVKYLGVLIDENLSWPTVIGVSCCGHPALTLYLFIFCLRRHVLLIVNLEGEV